jgi:transposase-like protein
MSLKPKQRTAALLLGRGMTATETAEKLGICHTTIYKWKCRYPEFKALVEAEKKYIQSGSEYAWHVHASAIKAQISDLIKTALETLTRQMRDGKNEMAIIKAATYILDKYGSDHISDLRGKTDNEDEVELLSALRLVDDG